MIKHILHVYDNSIPNVRSVCNPFLVYHQFAGDIRLNFAVEFNIQIEWQSAARGNWLLRKR